MEPGPEDLKIITLARSARARVAAAEGAAVRDETGRTYAAAAVSLPSLKLSALRLAVAMAVSSGASSLEAAALVSDAEAIDPADLAVVREAGPCRRGVPGGLERDAPRHGPALTRQPWPRQPWPGSTDATCSPAGGESQGGSYAYRRIRP